MSTDGSISDFASNGAPSPDFNSAMAQLKFSIYNILQPDFGIKSQTNSLNLLSPTSSLLSLSPQLNLNFLAGLPQLLNATEPEQEEDKQLPAWIYCTRYSDRPSAGPRTRKMKRKGQVEEEKRPRTAFTPDQLERLKQQFQANRYLTEKRRQELAHELGLNESQIKIWFQNKRAKLKKAAIQRPEMAFQMLQNQKFNQNLLSSFQP